MTKQPKDEIALNVNIDKELSTLMSKICRITGKTKKAFIEEAIGRAVTPFCSYEYGDDDAVVRTCNPRKGLYINSDNESEIAECIILESTTMLGQDYVKIYKDGQLQKVPAQYVKEVTGS